MIDDQRSGSLGQVINPNNLRIRWKYQIVWSKLHDFSCFYFSQKYYITFDNFHITRIIPQSSTDKDKLSAEYCDDYGNCEPCENTISCGYFKPWTIWSVCSKKCGGGVSTRQREFISDIIVSDIEVEERKCNTASCPGWGDWRPWTGCSATCWESDAPKPSQSRYRCWEMAGGRKNCGNKKSQPGNGHLCGRSRSRLCYKEQERYCNTGKDLTWEFLVVASGFSPIVVLRPELKSFKKDKPCSKSCEWTQWSDFSSTCTPNCIDGIRVSRRSNNEDEGTLQEY